MPVFQNTPRNENTSHNSGSGGSHGGGSSSRGGDGPSIHTNAGKNVSQTPVPPTPKKPSTRKC